MFVLVGKSNFTRAQLRQSRSMCLLHLQDGKLRRQQVRSGRSREAGEFQTVELQGDQSQTRNVVRVSAAERASVLVP